MNRDDAAIIELRAAIKVGDEVNEVRHTAHAKTIGQRVAAATDGPWILNDVRHHQGGQIRIWPPSNDRQIANVLRSGPNAAADAALISHAPQDLAWLLAEVDRIRTERDWLLAGASDEVRDRYFGIRAAEASEAARRRQEGSRRGE